MTLVPLVYVVLLHLITNPLPSFPTPRLSSRAAKKHKAAAIVAASIIHAWTLSPSYTTHRCPWWTNIAYQDLFIMAAQAALIAETIAGMKRAISGAYSSDSDNSVQKPTNRGNKLKRKAQYIHEGQLGGHTAKKKRIVHAGHHRYIVRRNPKRYDEYGDELEDDEEDEQADAAAAESNSYGDIKLEYLLAPLTSAAELANHPSMATPYKSDILGALVQRACEMVHKEKKTLWLVKHLAMKFRGDPSWIPCEAFCSDNDAALFASQRIPTDAVTPGAPQLHEPNLANGNAVMLKTQNTIMEGRIAHDHTFQNLPGISPQTLFAQHAGTETNEEALDGLELPNASTSDDTAVARDTVSLEQNSNPRVSLSGQLEVVIDQPVKRRSEPEDISPEDANSPLSPLAAVEQENHNNNQNSSQHSDALGGPNFEKPPLQDKVLATIDPKKSANEGVPAEEIPAPIHRMTTRAQAQAVSDKTTSTHSRSQSPDSKSPPYVHPLYLIPPSALPDRDFGLPPDEAEETRCILMLWVQKQEEVCRGVEQLYEGLLKADRMRKTVLRWCKAEGHIGAMSDGEDWYDREEWGLEEDLKKGQVEEEDNNGNQGKKTRGRRAQ
ncbi:MAG: hypothetical protein Q9187_000342 [Circinaria calcarea]